MQFRWSHFAFLGCVVLLASSSVEASESSADCDSQLRSIGLLGRMRDGIALRVFSRSLPEVLSQASTLPEDQVILYPLRLWKFGADRHIILANKKAFLITPHAQAEKRAYGWYQFVELEVIDRQVVMKGRTTFNLGSISPIIRSPLGRYTGWRFQLDDNLRVWVRDTLNQESGEFDSELPELYKMKKIQRAPKFHSFRAIAARVALAALLISPFPFGSTSGLTGKMIPPILSPVHQMMAEDLYAAMQSPGVWMALKERALVDGKTLPPEGFGISGYGQLNQLEILELWAQAKSAQNFISDEARKKEWFGKLSAAVEEALLFQTESVSIDLLDEIVPQYKLGASKAASEISMIRILELAPALDTQGKYWSGVLDLIPDNSKWLAWNRNPQTAPFYDPAVEIVFDSFPVDAEARDRAREIFDDLRKGDFVADADLARLSLLKEVLKRESISINETLRVLKALGEYRIPESETSLNEMYEKRMLIPVLKEAYGGDEQKVSSTLVDMDLMDIVILNQKGGFRHTLDRISESLPEDQYLRFLKDFASSAPGIVSSRARAFYADGTYDWLEKKLDNLQSDADFFDRLIGLIAKMAAHPDRYPTGALRDLENLIALTNSPQELERRVTLLIQSLDQVHQRDSLLIYQGIADGLPSTVFARDPEGLDLARQLKSRIMQAIERKQQSLQP